MQRQALVRGFFLGPLAAVGALACVPLVVGGMALALGGQWGAGLTFGLALTVPVFLLGLPVAYAAAAVALLLAGQAGADVRAARSSWVIVVAVVAGAVAATALWLLLDRGLAWPWIFAVLPFAAFGGWVFDRSSR